MAVKTASILLLPMALAACCACAPRPTPLDRSVQIDAAMRLIQGDYAKVADRIRISVAEYYNNYGKLPTRNQDAGLPAPQEYRGDTLRSASIGADGAITLEFDASSGRDGGRIVLIPDLAHVAAMGVQWHCRTPDYPQIRAALPGCAYTGH
ncbi:MAG: pilin [Proteobacteria bacterium]|nr:pilin [Pseudomonadota bacterium]